MEDIKPIVTSTGLVQPSSNAFVDHPRSHTTQSNTPAQPSVATTARNDTSARPAGTVNGHSNTTVITPSTSGTVATQPSPTTGSPAEPPAKRQRIRFSKPEVTCRLCGEKVRYLRHHYAKRHPELVTATGDVVNHEAQLYTNTRSPRSFVWQGGEHTAARNETYEDEHVRGSGARSNGHHTGQTMTGPRRTFGAEDEHIGDSSARSNGHHLGQRTAVPRRTFGGVPAGRFCARCGLVVEDLILHRRLEHGIENADVESTRDAIVQYESGSLYSSSVSTQAPIADVAAQNAIDHRPTTPKPIQSPTRPSPPRNQASGDEQPRTPQRSEDIKTPTSSIRELGDNEEPYEKLLRIIRSTAELTTNQRNSLIYGVLKQQVDVLPQSSVSPQSLARRSTVFDTPETTPQHVEQGIERYEAERWSSSQQQRLEQQQGRQPSQQHKEREVLLASPRGRNLASRDADEDDLYS